MISLSDGIDLSAGDRLWGMLHNDNGIGGEYEFDGANDSDNPITFSSIDVTMSETTNYDVNNDGLTNNGAQLGTVTFTVPNDAPNTLFYNCEFHSSMTGTISITD